MTLNRYTDKWLILWRHNTGITPKILPLDSSAINTYADALTSIQAPRLRLSYALQYLTGCRVSEISKITPIPSKEPTNIIIQTEKTHTNRIMRWNEEMTNGEEISISRNGQIITTEENKLIDLYYNFFPKIEYGKERGILAKSHILRYLNIWALNKYFGLKPIEIMGKIGHTNIKTTETYLGKAQELFW